jgi:hypothetical protein
LRAILSSTINIIGKGRGSGWEWRRNLQDYLMGMKFSALIINKIWSTTTLNYRMMVEGYPNLKEEVGGSNPGCEISSLPDGSLARWSTASYVLALTC